MKRFDVVLTKEDDYISAKILETSRGEFVKANDLLDPLNDILTTSDGYHQARLIRELIEQLGDY